MQSFTRVYWLDKLHPEQEVKYELYYSFLVYTRETKCLLITGIDMDEKPYIILTQICHMHDGIWQEISTLRV